MAQFIRVLLDKKHVYINADQIVMVEDKSCGDVKECEIYFSNNDKLTFGITADRFFEIHDLDLID